MTSSNSRTGGRLLVDCLIALGAKHSFGVPGESYLAVLDALHDTKGQLDFTLCRNEGGAAFMAEAYGKLSGAPGICFVTRGPGATNASIGVHTAMQNSSPMLLFVGQVGTDMKEREAFQEIDYRAYFGKVAKWVTEIESVDRIPELVARAWSTALSGRRGPVVVALPENVLTEFSSERPCRAASIPEPAPDSDSIQRIRRSLQNAERPLILLGGSGWNDKGRAAMQSFAERNGIPVVAAFRFQDVFDNTSKCYAGEAGVGMWPYVKSLVSNADVIVAVGVRFGEMTTDAYSLLEIPHVKPVLIHTHASDWELGKIYAPDVAVHSGPNQMSEVLNEISIDTRPGWLKWLSDAREQYESSFTTPGEQPGSVNMIEVSRMLRNLLPDDVIVTNGAGNFTVWPNKFLCYSKQRRLLAPQSGAMGYGLPAAIAAKVFAPQRTVVCFAGDGDFQMNCQELGSAMQANAQPIVLLINNNSYGTIRMHQERHYPARVSATDIQNPDFVSLARSYGFHAETVNKTEDFASAFERAQNSKSGAVIEINVSVEAITPRQTLTQIRESSS
ncbi:MAG: thiamine pyrophosphate-binding protein [Pseudomonadota bacterium]